jgi:hypothetical protein
MKSKSRKKGTEDDNTGAAVEIRKSGDSKDEDMSKEDTSEDKETLEEDDDGNGKEPSG